MSNLLYCTDCCLSLIVLYKKYMIKKTIVDISAYTGSVPATRARDRRCQCSGGPGADNTPRLSPG